MWYGNSFGVIKSPRSITLDGITHPSAVFRSIATLATLGIAPARVESVDQRYANTGAESYTLADDGEWVISYATTDRPVDEVKDRIITDIKAYVGALLMPSDWRVIRASESGGSLGDWATWRAAVREKGDSLEAGVQAFASIEACRNWENHACQEERKIVTTDADGNETITEDTETVNRTVNKSRWDYPLAPDDTPDPLHVRWL